MSAINATPLVFQATDSRFNAANRLCLVNAHDHTGANGSILCVAQLRGSYSKYNDPEREWRGAVLYVDGSLRHYSCGFDAEHFHRSDQRDAHILSLNHPGDDSSDGFRNAGAKRHGDHHNNGQQPAASDYDCLAPQWRSGHALFGNTDRDWRDYSVHVEGDQRQVASRVKPGPHDWHHQWDTYYLFSGHTGVPGNGLRQSATDGDGVPDCHDQLEHFLKII